MILDEPTAVLAPQEVDDLFTTIRSLTEQGLSIFFISHKLEEVMEISDRVTVIRGGKVVQTLETSTTTMSELATSMVGRDVVLQVEKKEHAPGAEVLRLEGFVVHDQRGLRALKGVDLSVRRGEILGVAGIDGNGQIELEEGIIGLRKAAGGSIFIEGEDVTAHGVRGRIDRGLALIPQDRQKRGLILDFDIAENLLLGSQWKRPFSRPLGLDYDFIRAQARAEVEEFGIKTPSIDVAARTLSGGNQQKLILAREIDRDPKALIASQPTRGLDVGAIEFVHNRLLEMREKGVGIILISYELEEIVSLADRIVVLYEGEIVYEVAGADAVRETIGLAMTGGVPPRD